MWVLKLNTRLKNHVKPDTNSLDKPIGIPFVGGLGFLPKSDNRT